MISLTLSSRNNFESLHSMLTPHRRAKQGTLTAVVLTPSFTLEVIVCVETFCFVHTISHTKFNAIKGSWVEDGLLPRQRKRSVPHNAVKLSEVEYVVRFVLRYAEDNAILLPGRIPGYKNDDLHLYTPLFNDKTRSVGIIPSGCL